MSAAFDHMHLDPTTRGSNAVVLVLEDRLATPACETHGPRAPLAVASRRVRRRDPETTQSRMKARSGTANTCTFFAMLSDLGLAWF